MVKAAIAKTGASLNRRFEGRSPKKIAKTELAVAISHVTTTIGIAITRDIDVLYHCRFLTPRPPPARPASPQSLPSALCKRFGSVVWRPRRLLRRIWRRAPHPLDQSKRVQPTRQTMASRPHAPTLRAARCFGPFRRKPHLR